MTVLSNAVETWSHFFFMGTADVRSPSLSLSLSLSLILSLSLSLATAPPPFPFNFESYVFCFEQLVDFSSWLNRAVTTIQTAHAAWLDAVIPKGTQFTCFTGIKVRILTKLRLYSKRWNSDLLGPILVSRQIWIQSRWQKNKTDIRSCPATIWRLPLCCRYSVYLLF